LLDVRRDILDVILFLDYLMLYKQIRNYILCLNSLTMIWRSLWTLTLAYYQWN